jgi:hypothetical protein
VTKFKKITFTFGQSTYRRGPSEAGGLEAADLRAKGLVPAANVWFYCKPKNSLFILFTLSYKRHAAFKIKRPLGARCTHIKATSLFYRNILSSYSFMTVAGVESFCAFFARWGRKYKTIFVSLLKLLKL